MSIWLAIFFGLVQGLTEYLPVSSSAHLAVLANLFGLNNGSFNMAMFSVFVHFGTLLSALLAFRADFGEILFQSLEYAGQNQAEGRVRTSFPAVRLFLMMLLAILPLFLILPLNRRLSGLSGSSGFNGIMLALSGLILYISDQLKPGKKTERSMSFSDSLIVGICQTVSAIPGLSRTGVVYTAGVAVGLSREFAVKFAVMLSVPVMFGANLIRLFAAAPGGFSWGALLPCFIGLVAAFVGGIVSINTLKDLAKKGRFSGVAYYACVAGALSVILSMIF